jgi:hypothetical protein
MVAKQWTLRVLVFVICVATSGVFVAVGQPAAGDDSDYAAWSKGVK